MAPLLIASTPIGNIGDATDRLRSAIMEADLIAAEDSRKFHRLVADLGIRFSARLLSFFEGNESDRVPILIAEIESGKTVLLVTDAGTPSVSDPGYRLINETISRGLAFTVIPGPSAVLTALLYSGFATATFAFDGFLPRTSAAVERYFRSISNESRTIVTFESPRRLESTLRIAREVLGDERQIAICREMTKRYEEIFRGSIEAATDWAVARQADEGIKGEITLVFAPTPRDVEYSDEEILVRVSELFDEDHSSKEIASIITAEFAIAKRRAYDLTHQVKDSHQESPVDRS
jgi:16S rRNA (cytidine1402-2'-O)-methyltransferase